MDAGARFAELPCGIVLTDTEDLITDANEAFQALSGFATAELLGRPLSSLLDAGSQAFYATQYQDQLWSQSRVDGIALTLVRADGTHAPILVNARTDDEDRGEQRAIVAVFDAGARQDFEREMLAAKRAAEASELRVRTLQDAAIRFLAVHDEEELASELALTIREAFDASEVAVVDYTDDGRTFKVIHGTDLRELLDAIRATRDDDRRALDPDQVVIIHDIEEAYRRSDRVGDLLRSVRGASFIAVPISDGDETLGAFGVVFGRPHRFQPATIDSYRALAQLSGLALSRVRLQQDLRNLATRDPLTGVANRFTIDERVAAALQHGIETDSPVTVIFLDLDGFKAVNDRFGHRVGDLVLRSTADRLRATTRDSDTIGRFGGDEFLVLCEGTGADVAATVAQRIADAIRVPVPGVPDGTIITASIGIATFQPGSGVEHTADSLTGLADAAMYTSKRDGRDRVTGMR